MCCSTNLSGLKLYATLWQAIGNAQENILGENGNFAAIFSPQAPDDTQAAKFMWDFLTIGLVIISSAAFSGALAGIAAGEVAKDAVNAAVPLIIGAGTDQSSP
jgi:hypothetical protein